MTTAPELTGKRTESLSQKEVTAMFNHVVQADGLPATMKPVTQPTVTVARVQIARTTGGRFVSIPLEPRVGLQVYESERPGKVWNGGGMSPETMLRSFWEKGEAYEKAPDVSIQKAAFEAASRAMLSGQACRQLSRAIAAALEIRAGLTMPGTGDLL